jgi:hypothetical protein
MNAERGPDPGPERIAGRETGENGSETGGAAAHRGPQNRHFGNRVKTNAAPIAVPVGSR